MTDLFVYLFKVNIALILLYGFYRLLLQWDTFLQWKRIVLVSIFFVSLLYPFWNLPQKMMESRALEEASKNVTLFPSYYLNEVVVTANPSTVRADFSLMNYLPEILSGIYILGILIVLSWFVIQLISVFRTIYKTNKQKISGHWIHIQKGLEMPFSFFHWVVVDPDQYSEEELHEILQHENTHVTQKHSIDVLLSELMCALCWFNPFVWLMKREIRMNLEFLADRGVMESGYDTEHYQFHLLRLSYHKAAAKITNNFNVSPLKKRISMMNKKQTSIFGLTKYVLFLPLVAGLILFNTVDVLSSRANNQYEMEAIELITHPNELDIEEATTVFKKKEDTPQKKEDAPQKKKKDSCIIHEKVDTPPQYPGGVSEMMKFLSNNLQYPVLAQEENIQGRVTVRFVIKKDGSVDDIQILRSLHPILDSEAVRVVNTFPKWIPGELDGEPVNVWFVLPINFKLQDQASSTEEKTE